MAHEFTGHLYIFHSFDVGDDIDFDLIKSKKLITRCPLEQPRYFTGYHKPLCVELPHPHGTSHYDGALLYQFGAISIRYKVPFSGTLQELRSKIDAIESEYREQAVNDAATIFKAVKKASRKPNFFNIARSYVVIQLDKDKDVSGAELKEKFGDMIASALRFEGESLSESKKNEILSQARGYYRGDLIVIDTEAAFVYDEDYEELLGLFEFVNIQYLELQYFDQLLDGELNKAYNFEVRSIPLRAYIPMWSTRNLDRILSLSYLKVEISVITERLENSIKLIGEPYFSEIYEKLSDTFDLESWKESIHKKLVIIQDINSMAESKIRTIREDMFNILIVILIFLEFIVATMQYLKG